MFVLQGTLRTLEEGEDSARGWSGVIMVVLVVVVDLVVVVAVASLWGKYRSSIMVVLMLVLLTVV